MHVGIGRAIKVQERVLGAGTKKNTTTSQAPLDTSWHGLLGYLSLRSIICEIRVYKSSFCRNAFGRIIRKGPLEHVDTGFI